MEETQEVKKKEKKTALVMQQEQRGEKKVQKEEGATFHFVQSDMMKHLITDSEHRLCGKRRKKQTHRQG